MSKLYAFCNLCTVICLPRPEFGYELCVRSVLRPLPNMVCLAFGWTDGGCCSVASLLLCALPTLLAVLLQTCTLLLCWCQPVLCDGVEGGGSFVRTAAARTTAARPLVCISFSGTAAWAFLLVQPFGSCSRGPGCLAACGEQESCSLDSNEGSRCLQLSRQGPPVCAAAAEAAGLHHSCVSVWSVGEGAATAARASIALLAGLQWVDARAAC